MNIRTWLKVELFRFASKNKSNFLKTPVKEIDCQRMSLPRNETYY